MTDRLVAFGCSNTYGHGLPDCIEPQTLNPGQQPSQLSWPSILAQHLGKQCVNRAHPGSSNKRIWHTIVNFEYQPSDVVFILWSFHERTSIIKEWEITNLGPWSHEDYYREYFSLHDSITMSQLFVNHTGHYLRSKGIKFYNLVWEKKDCNILTLNDQTSEHIPIYMFDIHRIYPKALDNSHSGELAHKEVANKINYFLNNASV